MTQEFGIRPIAYIESDFSQKFGVPRQSGLVEELRARIVVEPEYSNPDAFRGLEAYSHLWLIWQFSKVVQQEKKASKKSMSEGNNSWHATVRPPRLGGNVRVGVFATRSPFRPNHLGLSCVKLDSIQQTEDKRMVLWVRGADLLDGTPIFDIKPYLPYVDSRPEAKESFTNQTKEYALQVECDKTLLEKLPKEKQDALLGVLRQDPRPSYQNDSERVYGMSFAGFEVKFQVKDNVLQVTDIE